MFRIVIEEFEPYATSESPLPKEEGHVIERYKQTVDVLDLRRVIDAINFTPRVYKPRTPKVKP